MKDPYERTLLVLLVLLLILVYFIHIVAYITKLQECYIVEHQKYIQMTVKAKDKRKPWSSIIFDIYVFLSSRITSIEY